MTRKVRIAALFILGAMICTPAVAQKSDDATALLKKVENTYRSLKSFQFEGVTVVEAHGPDIQSSTDFPFAAAFAASGKFRIETKNPVFHILIVSDGHTVWTYIPSTETYDEAGLTDLPVSPAGTVGEHARERFMASSAAAGLTFDVFQSDIAKQVKEAKILREEGVKLEGKEVSCYVVFATYERSGEEARELPSDKTLWIDKARLIVLRDNWSSHAGVASGVAGGSADLILSTSLTKARLNDPIPGDLFVFVPPSGAKEGKLPKIPPQDAKPHH